MTPTPDPTLNARLAPCPFCGHTEPEISRSTNGFFWGDCQNEQCNTEGPIRLSDAEAVLAWNRSDRTSDVQAAVAKAVEAAVNAENEACAKLLNNEADDYEADASRFRGGTDPHHYRMDLATTARKYAAAIRSRGVAGRVKSSSPATAQTPHVRSAP